MKKEIKIIAMNNISFIIALRLFYQSTKTMPNNRKIYFEKKIISKNGNLKKIKGHKITLKREDKIDKWISGNKFRKLKYIFLKLNKDKTQIKFYHLEVPFQII